MDVNPYKILGVRTDAHQDEIRTAFHRLALKYHPDKNPGSSIAAETFVKVNNAYEILSDPDKRARYDRIGSTKAVILPSKKHKYTVEEKIRVGDLSHVYKAKMETGLDVVLKVSQDSSVNDLLESEAKNLIKVRPPDSKEEGDFRRFPNLIESFKLNDGSVKIVNVFALIDTNFCSLDRIKQEFIVAKKPLRFEHPVWMFNRLLETLAVVHSKNILHLGMIPPHLVVFCGKQEKHEMTHGIKLIDWCYSKEVGHKASAISPAWERFYPPEILAGKIPGAAADIYMAAKCIEFILEVSKDVPNYLYNFLKGCTLANPAYRPNDASALYKEFREHMQQHYGPRKYLRFDLP